MLLAITELYRTALPVSILISADSVAMVADTVQLLTAVLVGLELLLLVSPSLQQSSNNGSASGAGSGSGSKSA